MKPLLPLAALACGTTALFFALWILVPAPVHTLWLVAVVSSEWSLHVGLLALIGVLLGLAAVRQRWRRAGALAAGCSGLALVLAAYPPLATLPVAASHGVDLSLARYAAPASATPAPPVQTAAFAHVDGQTLELDVYLPGVPPAPGSGRPAVVVVHGGSWNGGRRSDFPAWNAWLTTHGFAVFDVDYRLAPQPNWQTATDDVQQAVRWIRAHADDYGVDPARIALMGRSAGGHLALLAAYTASESDTTAVAGARVRAVVALYAPTDLAWGYVHPANPRVIDGPATLRRFTGGTPDGIPEVYAQASPIHHIHAAAPPTLLVHGERDQLVRSEHAVRLFEALQQAGGEAHHALLLPYAQHGFDYHFDGWGAQVTQAVVLRHLNRHVAGVGE